VPDFDDLMENHFGKLVASLLVSATLLAGLLSVGIYTVTESLVGGTEGVMTEARDGSQWECFPRG
jgi:hypothetical protein